MVWFQNPLYFQVLFKPVNAEQPANGTIADVASNNKDNRFLTSSRQPRFMCEFALSICLTDIPIPPKCLLDVGSSVQTRPLDSPSIPWHILPLLGIGFDGVGNLENVLIMAVLELLASIHIVAIMRVTTGNHTCLFQSFANRIECFRFRATG